MRGTGFVLLFSVATCVALWLAVTSWAQPRPSLERSLRYLHRPRSVDRIADRPILVRIGDTLLAWSTGDGVPAAIAGRGERWRQPLRLVERTASAHVGSLVAVAAAGLVVPTILISFLQFAGVLSTGVWVPAGLSVLAAFALPWAVHADTMTRSAERRVDVRHQLSAYLDMVTMLLAGNTGHEGALEEAARGGDGLLFRELRRRMREMATMGQSLVGALALVGQDFGVVELEQVAATTSLSAAEGAPVARTLAAKCSTLRSSLAAEQEAAARIRTDKVTPPLVGMAVLFMALIIYPALELN